MGKVLLSMHFLFLLLQPRMSTFGLWAALAEQMGAKWLFLEAKTLLIPFQHRDFPSWCGESNRYKPASFLCESSLYSSKKHCAHLKFNWSELRWYDMTIIVLICGIYSKTIIASLLNSPNSMLLFSPPLIPCCLTSFWIASSLVRLAKKIHSFSQTRE